MPHINILPDLLVNKIAAGEVIERPASVVKELVENSLDAKATHIEIAVEQGGRKLIRVVDDGVGMDADDLARSILPHATSKIRSEEDLFAIRTMGFRGEALPSIGSVSQLRILSRQADSNEAREICMAGDTIEPPAAAGGPPGTAVEVRELFFNVPARQKFLRTAQTEMGHITEQVARIALSHTPIEFRLLHSGRLVHHLRPADRMRSRIADLYGPELAENLLEFSRDERGLKIHGLAGLPFDSRSSTKWQYVFLNGRSIRDRFVSAAAREAYRGLIEANRHPVFFIALEVDPGTVDVNVHPTKSEVRWQDSSLIYSQVLSCLRDRFLNTNLAPHYRTDRSPGHAGMGVPGERPSDARSTLAGDAAGVSPASADGEVDDDLDAERRHQIRQSIADFFKRSTPLPSAPGAPTAGPCPPGRSTMGPAQASARRDPAPAAPSAPSAPVQNAASASRPPSVWDRHPAGPPSVWDRHLAGPPSVWDRHLAGPYEDTVTAIRHDDAATSIHHEPMDFDSPSGLTPGRLAGPLDKSPAPGKTIQVHRAFLVAETEDGLTIIDQHALHERILYEQIAEQISRGPLESQRLLIPDTIDVAPDHVALIETYEETLARLGFELGPYGPNTIAIHAAPSLMKADRLCDFLRDALDRLADRQAPASPELLMNDLIAMCACKAAVKAGDPLSREEIDALMAKRDRVERSSNCPHGRPTSLSLTLTDLEKQFKRT